MNEMILTLSIITAFIALISALISWLSYKRTKAFKIIEIKNKKINFLYKRLREYKEWINNYLESLRVKNKNKKINVQRPQDIFNYPIEMQDITIAQVMLMDTVMTSQILEYKSFNTQNSHWINVEYVRDIADGFVDKLNNFGKKLFEIANSRNILGDDQYFNEEKISKIQDDFGNLLREFMYIDFYKMIHHIVAP